MASIFHYVEDGDYHIAVRRLVNEFKGEVNTILYVETAAVVILGFDEAIARLRNEL